MLFRSGKTVDEARAITNQQVAEALDGLPGWSARLHAPVHVRAEDFFTGDGRPLGEGIRALVHERLGHRPEGRVHLLAQPRTWGSVFNPLAVYYCFDQARLDAVVLEVTNTPWRERQWYVLDARSSDEARVAKSMYVSPFLPVAGEYRLSLPAPGERLSLAVTLLSGGEPVLIASARGRRRPFTLPRLLGYSARYPWAPLRVALLIRWQGVLLLARRLPVLPRPARRSMDLAGQPQEGAQ